ncbi:MAG: trehalose-phosphatase [Acidobacteriota bacterium]
MRHILARANRDVLRQFACSRVLLAFDYDGTLAPIVSDPKQAAMRATTRALLSEIAKRYPCVVISGRARADALRRLRGVGAVEVIGNHGIEPWQTSQRGLLAVRRWQPTLARRLARLPGVRIENKVYSVAVHYRQSREKKKVRMAIHRTAAALGDVRLIRGKQVVNLLPNDAPHKGIALEKARTRFQCDTALYVGDDDTDEDVFALDQPGQLLTIRVGSKRDTLAGYFLRDQAEIDQLLHVLLSVGPERRQRAVTSAGQ